MTEPIFRVMARVEVAENGCWIWLGARDKLGYGSVKTGSRLDGSRRTRKTHQVTYEHFVGPIPVGQELDHLCRAPSCVNPQHLEPVTHAENLRRAVGTGFQVMAAKTHCPSGHPYDDENTYVLPSRPNARYCRECGRERARRRRREARVQ